MNSSLDSGDVALAIGTAKELVESVCKTILFERSIEVLVGDDIPILTKKTLKELKLIPDGIPDQAKGADIIKELLRSMSTIGINIGKLRNLYGTGHGKDGRTSGLSLRHAKLAVGAASTFTVFLLETYEEQKGIKYKK